MKTDPPTPPQYPRPKGKVFDVMRPGKAPASPSSRPVVIGHKPEAQEAQASVSGVGEPERRPLLDGRRKIEINPTDDTIDASQSTPKVALVGDAPMLPAAPEAAPKKPHPFTSSFAAQGDNPALPAAKQSVPVSISEGQTTHDKLAEAA